MLDVRGAVGEGNTIVGALKRSGYVSALAVSLTDVGEETGKFPQQCTVVADHYEKDLTIKVAAGTQELNKRSISYSVVSLLLVALAAVVLARRSMVYIAKRAFAAADEVVVDARIFLSYRRVDSEDFTARVFDFLNLRSPKGEVFRDLDYIKAGEDFREIIRRTLEKVDIVLVLIGPGWLAVDKLSGLSRFHKSEDVLRTEIEVALKLQKIVIPVLVRDTKLPDEGDLPESMRPLLERHAARVRGDPDFSSDMKRLCRHLYDDDDESKKEEEELSG